VASVLGGGRSLGAPSLSHRRHHIAADHHRRPSPRHIVTTSTRPVPAYPPRHLSSRPHPHPTSATHGMVSRMACIHNIADSPRVTSSPALGAARPATTRARRTRCVSSNPHITPTNNNTEGEAQVRAPATAHDAHRPQKEEGCRAQRCRQAPYRLPHSPLQTTLSADAAYPRPPAARRGVRREPGAHPQGQGCQGRHCACQRRRPRRHRP
jgi:hypothetical protein